MSLIIQQASMGIVMVADQGLTRASGSLLRPRFINGTLLLLLLLLANLSHKVSQDSREGETDSTFSQEL